MKHNPFNLFFYVLIDTTPEELRVIADKLEKGESPSVKIEPFSYIQFKNKNVSLPGGGLIEPVNVVMPTKILK